MKIIIAIINIFYSIGYAIRPKHKKTFSLSLKEFNKINTIDKIFLFIDSFKIANKFDTYYSDTPQTREYDILQGKNLNLPFILGKLLKKVGYESEVILVKGDKKWYYDIVYRDRKGNYILWNYGDIKICRSIKGCLGLVGKKKYVTIGL